MTVILSEYKRKVAKSFNRAVATYDIVADLQAEVGHALLDRITPYAESVSKFIDVGAGTGLFTGRIQEQFPQANCCFVDIAESMLARCYSRQTPGRSVAVCADFDALPFDENQFDCLFSSMCLQWSLDLTKTLTELLRVTAPGGMLALAFLTEGTLAELATSLNVVRQTQTVNTFYSLTELQRIISTLPVTLQTFTTDYHSKPFTDFAELMHFLKKTGANYCEKRGAALVSPMQWRQLESYYRAHYSQQDAIHASFNVTYILMRKN